MLITTNPSVAWRTFTIGGVGGDALIERVSKSSRLFGSVGMLYGRPFPTLKQNEEIDTIILTPADFGYERMPTTTELLDPTRLAEWSAQNLERLDGHVVELLPAEAGPHIRDQYKDQPDGELLNVGMAPLKSQNGYPGIFVIPRDGDERQLSLNDLSFEGLALDSKIVFRLRKVAQD